MDQMIFRHKAKRRIHKNKIPSLDLIDPLQLIKRNADK